MNDLEDRLAAELKAMAAALPPSKGSVGIVLEWDQTQRLHRRRHRLVAALAAIGLLVASYLTSWPPIPVGRSMVVAAGPAEEVVVTIAYLRRSASSETVQDWPGGALHYGRLGPQPAFDTSQLGPERTMVQSTPAIIEPWFEEALIPRSTDLPGIYLGHLPSGLSVSLTPGRACCGLDGLIEALVDPVPTMCVYMGNADSLGYVCYDESQLGTDTIQVTSKDGDARRVAAWFEVPEQAAVVVVERNGRAIAWQRPISQTAVFELNPEEDAEMVALDSQGMIQATAKVAGQIGPGSIEPGTVTTAAQP